jgi:L-threonylcarbamoyladenylate synthase
MEHVAGILNRGGIVAYPTETIYGLGVDAFNEIAIGRLLEIKGRPVAKPVSILVRDIDMLRRVVARIPAMARDIMEKFWPGPVTIIFPASEAIPAILTAHTGTVGVRISPHPFVERLFGFFNAPLTSTSANISGETSLLEPEDMLRTFGGRIDLVISMPESMGGVRSTVIDVTGDRPKTVRTGAVDMKEICAEENEPGT